MKNSEVNCPALLQMIREAPTKHALQFMGKCLRVQKQRLMSHTKDPVFMQECREAYAERMKYLEEYVEEYDPADDGIDEDGGSAE